MFICRRLIINFMVRTLEKVSADDLDDLFFPVSFQWDDASIQTLLTLLEGPEGQRYYLPFPVIPRAVLSEHFLDLSVLN